MMITSCLRNLQRIICASDLGAEMFPSTLLDLSHTNESLQDLAAVTTGRVSGVQKDDIATHKNLNVLIQPLNMLL